MHTTVFPTAAQQRPPSSASECVCTPVPPPDTAMRAVPTGTSGITHTTPCLEQCRLQGPRTYSFEYGRPLSAEPREYPGSSILSTVTSPRCHLIFSIAA